jgi:signal transduction histidine kinase
MIAVLPRVLMVDDSERVLDALEMNLSDRFAITTAHDGASALALIASSEPFEVVVSDMRMPGMDGVTFLTKVRDLAPGSTRILLTGHAELETVIAAVNTGNIYRFLSKPTSLTDIIGALDEGVAEHRRWVREERLVTRTSKRLLDSFSHRLRTPLTAVQVLAEELHSDWDGLTEAERREMIEIVARESRNLTATIHDMLAVGRSAAKDLAVLREPVNLLAELQRLRAEMPMGWHFEIEGDPAMAVAVADPERVVVAFRHLLLNAYEHGAAPVVVTVSRDTDVVLVRVTDHGDGIPDELGASAFEPFVTAARRRETAPGLGLAVAATLINEMGGSLDYRREQDTTVFETRFPADLDADAHQASGA